MKRVIAIILVVAASFQLVANDRFYIEDFSINPGDNQIVNIILENAEEYTAFQADIYLPFGLDIIKEEGDYLIDLTDRKGSDHIISSKLHSDGAIRIMSYSMGVKSYSGNNGSLVTMTIAAGLDFTAPASIILKNILFTTPQGEEVAFPDELCAVSYVQEAVKGDVNGDGKISISDVTALIDGLLENGNILSDSIADVNNDGTVSIADVTALIDKLLQGN